MRSEIEEQAVAFHYRLCERENAVPWQPSNVTAYPTVGAVVLSNVRETAIYSFHKSESGKLRFRATDCTDERVVKQAAKTPTAENLQKIGLSTREIARILGVSHETARKKANPR